MGELMKKENYKLDKREKKKLSLLKYLQTSS